MKKKFFDLLIESIFLSQAIIRFGELLVSKDKASALVVFTIGFLPIFGSIILIARRKNKDP
jgi:hypothetical protein